VEDELSWWLSTLPRLHGTKPAKVRLIVSAYEREPSGDAKLPLRLWLEIAWYVISHDPYQRRAPKWIVAAICWQWALAPLGREVAEMVGGQAGLVVGLVVVLLPALLIFYCIGCFYQSWQFQSKRWAMIFGEG
jgi:hypothetical protein